MKREPMLVYFQKLTFYFYVYYYININMWSITIYRHKTNDYGLSSDTEGVVGGHKRFKCP